MPKSKRPVAGRVSNKAERGTADHIEMGKGGFPNLKIPH